MSAVETQDVLLLEYLDIKVQSFTACKCGPPPPPRAPLLHPFFYVIL